MLQREERNVIMRVLGAGCYTPYDCLIGRQGYYDVRIPSRMPLSNDRTGRHTLSTDLGAA